MASGHSFRDEPGGSFPGESALGLLKGKLPYEPFVRRDFDRDRV